MVKARNAVKKTLKALLPYGLFYLYKKFVRKNKMPREGYYTINAKTNLLEAKCKNQPQFIVTLTTHGKRVKEKCPYAVMSILNQSVPPDRIVLYLAHGTKIPERLKKLKRHGLEIRFCDDIKSYTKLIPALADFPDDILVTADDDICYDKEWLKLLKESYEKHPEKIHCHRAHEICLDENREIIPYNEWRQSVRTIENARRIFPTGVGGILYPPHSFTNEIMDIEKIKRLAPSGDDIWFWAMARHNKKEYKLVRDCIRTLNDIGINDDGLWRINVAKKKNDEQIKNVLKEYPDVYESIK
jgi:hypothetical protein